LPGGSRGLGDVYKRQETLLKEPSVLPSARGTVTSKRPAKAPVSENANFTLSPY
jgi:hypothetical protein